MYHCSVGTRLGHENYIYTKLCKSAEKPKIKDFKSTKNNPLIVLDYWPNKNEEYFHLRNSDRINLSKKSTTQYMKKPMDIMVKQVNSMEQGMIGLQEKFIE